MRLEAIILTVIYDIASTTEIKRTELLRHLTRIVIITVNAELAIISTHGGYRTIISRIRTPRARSRTAANAADITIAIRSTNTFEHHRRLVIATI